MALFEQIPSDGERRRYRVTDPVHFEPIGEFDAGSAEDVRAFFVLDSFTDRVVDAVGAGDALLAYATLAMKATGAEVIAGALGSFAAAVECERDGNIPVSPADVLAKIDQVERRAEFGGP